ncbi:hypothetical protein [Streptomyces sp. NPDC007355]|uniref:hypothetical protein n=1 Tax=Streptomyces sp. NPDC007355 TaxID=3364778 RepID=UPI0036C17349
MFDSTQPSAEQSVAQPVQPPASEPPAPERAAEPAVAFLRRHGGVILLALLLLGYVLHDRPALRETIGAPIASPGIALTALTLLRRR